MNEYVVDTCVLLDIFEGVEPFATQSANALDAYGDSGLLIAPITYVEMAPAFRGNLEDLDSFLSLLGIRIALGEPLMRIKQTAIQWATYVARKRKGEIARRPMADLLIGTCALSYQGLITRNAKDFASLFPAMTLIVPS